jgi:hypothetical protein
MPVEVVNAAGPGRAKPPHRVGNAKSQVKSAVTFVADAVYTVKFENRITYEGERERNWR